MSVVTQSARRWAALAVAGLCALSSGCEQPTSPALLNKADGRVAVSLLGELPAGIESLQVHGKLYWLEGASATPYYEFDETSRFIFMPCYSGPTGAALTQLTLDATVKFLDSEAVYSAHSTAFFTCKIGADEPVSIVLDLVRIVPIGGGDTTVSFGGSECTSTLGLVGDQWLAICASRSCNSSSAAFLFSNVCRDLFGAATDIWTCGSFADWTIVGSIARATYRIPRQTFSATLGLAAVPRQVLAKPDLKLTDAAGNRKVFTSIARLFATLSGQNGVVGQPAIDPDKATDFIAVLEVPGTSGRQILLEADVRPTGGRAIVWKRSGDCKVPALGAPNWTLFPIALQLDGPSAVNVLLGAVPGGVASAKARCAMAATGDVTCTAPTALGVTP